MFSHQICICISHFLFRDTHVASYNHQDFIASTVKGRDKFHPRTGHEGSEVE
jgi:hypothetical protein